MEANKVQPRVRLAVAILLSLLAHGFLLGSASTWRPLLHEAKPPARPVTVFIAPRPIPAAAPHEGGQAPVRPLKKPAPAVMPKEPKPPLDPRPKPRSAVIPQAKAPPPAPAPKEPTAKEEQTLPAPAHPKTEPSPPVPMSSPPLLRRSTGAPGPPPETGAAALAPNEPAAPEILEARPLYDHNPPPSYPPLARRREYQGTVLLEVLVDLQGRVGDLRVAASSGYGVLDRAALAAVRSWRFAPGTRGGEPVEMWVQVPLRFELE